jgi:hypothetical protein
MLDKKKTPFIMKYNIYRALWCVQIWVIIYFLRFSNIRINLDPKSIFLGCSLL